LAWAILGFAEELEFFNTIDEQAFETSVGISRREVMRVFEQAAIDTAEHYIDDCAARDGIVYWDDGAPDLHKLKNWREMDANPYNDFEPVDSSASAIAAQGLIRLGNHLGKKGTRFTQAGLTIAKTLLDEPYLSSDSKHQGLLLHSIYHRPNGWDHVPKERKIPCGESSMWGDYHLLELGLLIRRLARKETYPAFFDVE
jgi:hypothetical protein